MENEKKLIKTSPFMPDIVIAPVKEKNTSEDIIDYKVVERSVKTGDGPYDFVILKEVIEVGRRNRQDELNKYSKDVGCVNLIDKLRRQGVNAADGRFAAQPGFIDATKLPQDLEAMTDLAKQLNPSISRAWKAIPDELKKNMDLETFAKKYNKNMFNDFIKAKQAAKIKKEPAKETSKVVEKEGEK